MKVLYAKHVRPAQRNRLVAMLAACVLVCGLVFASTTPSSAHANASAGILNNGLDGITIDINSDPYAYFATKPSGGYAYGTQGCAWFASARICDLTGIDVTIRSGKNWYDFEYAKYGFSRGTSVPTGKALACFTDHVLVIENVSGDTYTISEGGMSSAGSEHGYCQITTMSREDLESASTRGYGSFLGYVYLGVSFPSCESGSMFRLYNPNSGEHFYTASSSERDNLVVCGWTYEGVAWNAPSSGYEVFRLYNPNGGDHHYTMSAEERDWLIGLGWRYEGVGWHSDTAQTTPLYRLYNPNAETGSHHYTMSVEERDGLVALGWNDEGIGWYGL